MPVPELRPLRRPPWGLLITGGVLTLLAVAVGVISWLHSLAGNDPLLRMDAVRTGFTVAFGAGGLITLALIARRQWLQERDQRHREEVAAGVEFDATERRITDLYVKAVDQLGSESAAVRLGGLYALERLGISHPAHRQVVVNVICAYLRMPYQREDPPSPEHQVRIAAQRMLTERFRDPRPHEVRDRTTPEATPEFWPGMIADLSGAELDDLDLRNCHLLRLRCNATRFRARAMFGDLTVIRTAFFHESRFDGPAQFPGAHFGGAAVFDDVEFAGPADFGGAVFASLGSFDRAVIAGELDFTGAEVRQPSARHAWPPGWGIGDEVDGVARLVPNSAERDRASHVEGMLTP
ncbi:pentapeptide repeat-containing protein [Phytomonospora sp. NPDC050363]|uniref:pentapeptide repeat-containing protein n=1 Tax=Phytomonospora sp. NPDC050363 TaxID=3155642 RepID=UPI0033EA9642